MLPQTTSDRFSQTSLHGFRVYTFRPSASARRNTGVKVVFSHATGMAALTYRDFLAQWAEIWGVDVIAYDARGIGRSEVPIVKAQDHAKKDLPDLLSKDLSLLLDELSRQHAREQGAAVAPAQTEPPLFSQPPLSSVPRTRFILAGHSLGALVSLLTAFRCGLNDLVLFDPVLLPSGSALLWGTVCLVRQRHLHPLAGPARRRKRFFHSKDEAVRVFKRIRFLKGWPVEKVEAFIEANYAVRENGELLLRHDPDWEADLFESQPASTAAEFFRISKRHRTELRPWIICGAQSDTCDPKGEASFRRFFPHAMWNVVPNGGHMFPFEQEQALLRLLELKGEQILSGK